MINFVFFCCLSGVCLGLKVDQSPSDLITKPGPKVQVFCRHPKTDYYMMLWYQRSPGDTAMKLIGYLYHNSPKMESQYENLFDITGDLSGPTSKESSLNIQVNGTEQSAVYFCAASQAQ